MAGCSTISFYSIWLEVFARDLNVSDNHKLIVVDWCELGCQTIRKATVYLAKQHALTDQLDVKFF